MTAMIVVDSSMAQSAIENLIHFRIRSFRDI